MPCGPSQIPLQGHTTILQDYSHLQFRIEFSLEPCQLGQMISQDDQVIHIDEHCQQVLTRLLDVQQMIRFAPREAFLGEKGVYPLIPCSWRLLEPVQRLLELAHKMLEVLHFKSLRLTHVDVFLQLAIQKCGLHIHLMDLQIQRRPERKDAPNGVELGYRCKGLKEVDSPQLEKTPLPPTLPCGE